MLSASLARHTARRTGGLFAASAVNLRRGPVAASGYSLIPDDPVHVSANPPRSHNRPKNHCGGIYGMQGRGGAESLRRHLRDAG